MDLRQLASDSADLNSFFAHYFKNRMQSGRQLSLRALSLKLGYKNPSYLSDILNSRRKVNADFLLRFQQLEKLEASEVAYLNNLLLLETSSIDSLKVQKSHENNAIRELWKTRMKSVPDGLKPVDLILLEAVGNFSGVTQGELAAYLKNLISENQIESRVDVLLQLDFLQLNDGKLFARNENRRFKFSEESYSELASLLRQASDQMYLQAILAFRLRPENSLRAKSILHEALEKIAILSSEDEKLEGRREVLSLYTAFFKVAPEPEAPRG